MKEQNTSINQINIQKNKREKGRYLFEFPVNYTVVDIETTGLSPEYDSIIELSALKIVNGIVQDRFSSLVRPEEKIIEDKDYDNGSYPKDLLISSEGRRYYYINEFIENLTGITNPMLKDAPMIKDVIKEFELFLGESIIVGHNVNFDINFLYDEYERVLKHKLKNDYIDTMRIAKRVHPELEHHRLVDIVELYGIDTIGIHRAFIDCDITNRVFCRMKEEVIEKYGDVVAFCLMGNKYGSQKQKAKDLISQKKEFDESHPLYGKRCVITGVLERMTRQQAMQLIVDFGGINEDNVTKGTNYLILGNNEYNHTKEKGKSTKYLKAEKYKLARCDIEMIPEQVFYDMILDNLS